MCDGRWSLLETWLTIKLGGWSQFRLAMISPDVKVIETATTLMSKSLNPHHSDVKVIETFTRFHWRAWTLPSTQCLHREVVRSSPTSLTCSISTRSSLRMTTPCYFIGLWRPSSGQNWSKTGISKVGICNANRAGRRCWRGGHQGHH